MNLGDSEDRARLEKMTEREREEELFKRAETREAEKKRFEIQKKLKKEHKLKVRLLNLFSLKIPSYEIYHGKTLIIQDNVCTYYIFRTFIGSLSFFASTTNKIITDHSYKKMIQHYFVNIWYLGSSE